MFEAGEGANIPIGTLFERCFSFWQLFLSLSGTFPLLAFSSAIQSLLLLSSLLVGISLGRAVEEVIIAWGWIGRR